MPAPNGCASAAAVILSRHVSKPQVYLLRIRLRIGRRLFARGARWSARGSGRNHGSGNDVAAQTRDALRRIEAALGQAGARLADVVRTRIYVTDISRWREIGELHAEIFGDIRPVATMVGVSALIAPGLLVEIEADAYLEA
ncbi:endoribonuclease L-PSP [Mycobacterium gastri 'Wayne']|nr:endoribonuclease L-PSP [Mycobacterium gastri 'Wayne']